MERFDKFVYLPELAILRGIKVDAKTKKHFEKDLKDPEQKVVQDLDNLVLTTKITTVQGSNVIKSEVITYLVEGEILLFDENYGFTQSAIKVGTIEEALATIKAQKSVIDRSNKEYEKEKKKEEKKNEPKTK